MSLSQELYEFSIQMKMEIFKRIIEIQKRKYLMVFFSYSLSKPYTVKIIRRFYGKIPGIWLPVLLPLFLRAFTCRTFLEIKIWQGYVNRQYSKIPL